MGSGLRKKLHIATYVPPWMILGAVFILLVVVVLLAIQNVNREKRYMSKILIEKGAALIKSFEAGARTGMMGMMWGGDQVQNLLEETARQPGILYLTVTDKDGVILAHSDRAKIGKRFLESSSIKDLEPGIQERWRLTDSDSGHRSFEVYRYFRPMTDAGAMRRRRGMMHGMMTGRQNDWGFPSNVTGNDQVIFVGLDVEPFESAQKEDIRNTIVISSVLLLLGFGGFFSMFLAQSYRTTRRMLQDTSAFATELVTSLPVGLIATGRDGRIAFFNEAASEITGLRFDDVRGKEPDQVLPSHLCGLKTYLERGESILEKEIECTFAKGNPVPLSVSATQITNEEGFFVGNVLILRDLGEIRRLQEEIRRKEKMAALGGLAAGMAHEIRNPLSSIKGLATYFGSKFAEGSEDREVAAVMVGEVERLNRVITELLEFARPSELKLKPTDINQLLRHSLRLIQQDATVKKIDVHLSEAPNLPPVPLDPDRFTQCLLNLYLNAIQAMEEGGHLSVRSRVHHKGSILVEVEDTGQGIGEGDLGRIFDPYFTTKPSGTGLGLAIVHKIVDAHNGTISVSSEPGKDTVFTISLNSQVN